MKIWSYQGGGAWAVAIKAGTFSGEAHTELKFDIDVPEPFFSSTMDTGPRFATFDKLVSQNPNDWLVTDLGVSEEDERLVYRAAQMIKNQAAIYGEVPTYNKEGICFNFLLQPIVRQNPEQYFCSQVVCTACQTIGLFQNMVACLMDPGDTQRWLYKYLPKWQSLRDQTKGM